MSPTKVPKSWPEFILKCAWDSTAKIIKLRAKDESDAVDRGWKIMTKTEGGEKCQSITIREIR